MYIHQLNKKALFWKLASHIQNCPDAQIENSEGVVIEIGVQIDDEHSVLFGIDSVKLHFYKDGNEIISFSEDSDSLYIVALLFEQLFANWGNDGSLLNLNFDGDE